MPGEQETQNSNEQESTTSLATQETTTQTEQTNESEQASETSEKSTTTEEFVPLTAEDITFPDGFTVDEEYRDNFLKIINDQEMSSKDRAQGLTDLYTKAAQAASEASSKAWEETQTTWRNEVKADPEIGGDKLQPTLGRIGRLIDEYGSPEVVQAFDSTGAGNHPAVIRMLNKVADKLLEGTPVTGTPTTADKGSAASRLFPSMKN